MITPAFAQTTGAGGGDILGLFFPLILVFGIFYLLVFRPQQKRMKEHQAMIDAVKRGDTIVTSGGLVGKVTKVVDDDQVEFEIADGVRVRQMRQMISGVRAKGEPAKESAKDEASAS